MPFRAKVASKARCQHGAADFVSRLTKDFQRPGVPANGLFANTSFLTALPRTAGLRGSSGDRSRPLESPGCSDRHPYLHTTVLTGSGGRLAGMPSIAISAPRATIAAVQVAQFAVRRILSGLVERDLVNTREQRGNEGA